MTPEVLVASLMGIAAIIGALIGQIPTFLSRRKENSTRTHDQSDRWEERAFELAEKILGHASQLDSALRRREGLATTELSTASEMKSLDIWLAEALDEGKEGEPENVKEARLAFRNFIGYIYGIRRDLDGEIQRHVTSIWELRGPLSTYLPRESHIALVKLSLESEKRLKGGTSMDLDMAIMQFSVALREDFLKTQGGTVNPAIGKRGRRWRSHWRDQREPKG